MESNSSFETEVKVNTESVRDLENEKNLTAYEDNKIECAQYAQPINANVNRTKNNNSQKIVIALVTAIAAVVAVIAGIIILPKIFITVDALCSQGDYSKAYEIADEDTKFAIKAESIAARASASVSEALKDPSSFKLREVYYEEKNNNNGELVCYLVLCISGTNSYGATVSSHCLYSWEESNGGKWNACGIFSDLAQEEYDKDYYTREEKLEIAQNNVYKSQIKLTMTECRIGFFDNCIQLEKESIDRINALFEKDALDAVEMIPVK